MRSSACLTVLGLALSIAVGCVKPGIEDDTATDQSETETGDESTDTQPGSDETPSEETDTDETEGADTDDDPPPPKPCTWTDFPSQYGLGNLGQNCGSVSGIDPAPDEFELVFACLQDAYDVQLAAFATASWSDDGDNTRKAEWYVRPPNGDKPRRIEAQYFRKYDEEGAPPPGKWTVASCTDFVLDCDFPHGDCVACTDPVTLICGATD